MNRVKIMFKLLDYITYALVSSGIVVLLFSWKELQDMFLQLSAMEFRVIVFIAILGRHLDYVYCLLKWVIIRISDQITSMFYKEDEPR